MGAGNSVFEQTFVQSCNSSQLCTITDSKLLGATNCIRLMLLIVVSKHAYLLLKLYRFVYTNVTGQLQLQVIYKL